MQELIQYAPILPLAFLCVYVFWRQKREQKRRSRLLGSLKKGERVVTIGGMLGTITALNNRTVTLRVSEKVEVDFLRSSVADRQSGLKNSANKPKPEKEPKRVTKTAEQNKPASDNAAKPEEVAEKTGEAPAE